MRSPFLAWAPLLALVFQQCQGQPVPAITRLKSNVDSLGITMVLDGNTADCWTSGCWRAETYDVVTYLSGLSVSICSTTISSTAAAAGCPNPSVCVQETGTSNKWCNRQQILAVASISTATIADTSADMDINGKFNFRSTATIDGTITSTATQGTLTAGVTYEVRVKVMDWAGGGAVGDYGGGWSNVLTAKAMSAPAGGVVAANITSLVAQDGAVVVHFNEVAPSLIGTGASQEDITYEAYAYDVSRWYDFHMSHFTTEDNQPVPLADAKDGEPWRDEVANASGTTGAAGTPITVAGLDNNASYAFVVRIRNNAGSSTPDVYSAKTYPDECWEWAGQAKSGGVIVGGLGGPQIFAAAAAGSGTVSPEPDEYNEAGMDAGSTRFHISLNDPVTQAPLALDDSRGVEVLFTARGSLTLPVLGDHVNATAVDCSSSLFGLSSADGLTSCLLLNGTVGAINTALLSGLVHNLTAAETVQPASARCAAHADSVTVKVVAAKVVCLTGLNYMHNGTWLEAMKAAYPGGAMPAGIESPWAQTPIVASAEMFVGGFCNSSNYTFEPFSRFDLLPQAPPLYMYRPVDWMHPFNEIWQGNRYVGDPTAFHRCSALQYYDKAAAGSTADPYCKTS